MVFTLNQSNHIVIGLMVNTIGHISPSKSKKYSFQYKVPSRGKLRGLVNGTNEKVKIKIRTELSKARKVSISTDGWAGKNSRDAFLGQLSKLTLHY